MTLTNNTLYKALITILADANLGYPIIYPGETKSPPASGVWLVVSFMPNRGINYDVGNDSEVTPQGLFQVQVFDRPSAYMDPLDNAAEAVVAAFKKGTRIVFSEFIANEGPTLYLDFVNQNYFFEPVIVKRNRVRITQPPYVLSLDSQSDRMSKVVTIPYSG